MEPRLATGPGDTLWIADAGGIRRAHDGAVTDAWADLHARALAPGDAADSVFALVGDELLQIGRSGVSTRAEKLPQLSAVAVDPGANELYVAPEGPELIRIDRHGRAARACTLPAPATSLALSGDRRRLYAACGEAITLIDLAAGDASELVRIPGAELSALAFTAAGMVAADLRGRLHGVNLRHATTIEIWRAADAQPCAVAFDRPGRRYVIADTIRPGLVAVPTDGTRAQPFELRYPSSPDAGGLR